MMEKPDTILFDFDGTLIDTKIDFVRMKEEILSLCVEYGVSPEPKLYALESIDHVYRILFEKDVLLADSFKDRATQILIDIEISATLTSKAFPDAVQTLKELKDGGVKVGIVTRNCRPAVLKSAEMAGFKYDLLLTRDDVKKVKPDPQHLLDALEFFGSKPDRSVMVGDHPMDILAGKRACMKTAAVLTMNPKEAFDEVAPDFILNDVSGILKVL